jgi:phenylpropionate dioxygenase-like ring-hydroxylating dioxygenase large terminal subunit
MSGGRNMAFVQNVWYPAAWADELGPTTLLARTIVGTPTVMFRTEQAGPAALLDRCPHRFAPLSRGRKQADGVACGYHGLAFNAAGVCIHNPHGPITRALAVNAYPCVERHEAIWLWPGDPDRADPALSRARRRHSRKIRLASKSLGWPTAARRRRHSRHTWRTRRVRRMIARLSFRHFQRRRQTHARSSAEPHGRAGFLGSEACAAVDRFGRRGSAAQARTDDREGAR